MGVDEVHRLIREALDALKVERDLLAEHLTCERAASAELRGEVERAWRIVAEQRDLLQVAENMGWRSVEREHTQRDIHRRRAEGSERE